MTLFRRFGALLFLLFASNALAQERGFRVHRYEGSTVGSWLFMLERPWYSLTSYGAVGITADYSHNALIPGVATGRGQLAPILEHALVGHVGLAGSLFDRFRISASLPVSLLERGTPEPVSGVGPMTTIVGIGDPRVQLMVRLFGQAERDAFSLHLGADVWIPIGAAAAHHGDVGIRALPRAVMAGAFGAGRWTVDLGFLYRSYASLGPPQLQMIAAPEARAGVALGVALLDDSIYLGPEAQFSMQVAGQNAFTTAGMNLELLGGLHFHIADTVMLGVAGGTSLFGMAGSPDARGIVRIAWVPRRNSDGDALPNVLDECPDVAGTREARGCAAVAAVIDDADLDGVKDDLDRCPFEPETRNGVRDEDGCPEYALQKSAPLAKLLAAPVMAKDAGVPVVVVDAGIDLPVAFAAGDADGDGIIDDVDRCPVDKEDFDGFEDEDGCPEDDNDEDLIADATDKCPEVAEARNGISDDDGCPDVAPDGDGDGVADALDRCPFEPETIDGHRDDDGCPEYLLPSTPALVQILEAPPKVALSEPERAALPAALVVPPTDADRDGIIDDEDRCPVTPEDKDGFEDDDGCPENDNDADLIADATDTCPEVAETQNAFKDDDGCPDEDPDTDGDGLGFEADRCPLEPGDKTDGCPREPKPALALPGFALPLVVAEAPKPVEAPQAEPVVATGDLDADGQTDDVDACPMSKEDGDGFEDEDGCPEPDNDQDGIPDSKDKCPYEAEVINGVKDEDGCPDKGEVIVHVTENAVVIDKVVQFKPGSATLAPSSTSLLKQVAATLKAARTLSVEIQGHTDDVGKATTNITLSQKRADAIKTFLIKAGVDTSRLVAKGYGPTRPRASNKTAKGREQNRRVEFLILGDAK
ncbi:MAG: OmpA family protein [Archangium sp.]